MSEPMTPRQLADALDPRDRATLRSLACALRSVRASNLYNDRCPVPNANSLTRDAFLSAATATLSLELAEALLTAIIDTGEDFDTCLDMVADTPQVYLVVVHSHDDTQVLAAALDMTTAWAWMEEHPDEAREASILPVRLLDPPLASDPCDHGAAKEDARNEARGDLGYREALREDVANALRRLYGPLNAESVIRADAFGALIYQVSQRSLPDGSTLAILKSIDPRDLEFAIHGADEPAAFLAAKVRDL